MYQCQNCGGNLKFDIVSQSMSCEHCNAHFDPYTVHSEGEPVESDTFAVTVFICPQCGGEIMASENSAAEFCLYCGSGAVLTSRIADQKRPTYIIPFKKTKEDCIKAYKKLMKRSLFAPKELKNPENLNRFRGIYMPYWVYQVYQGGDVNMRAKKVYQKGNYEITENYDVAFQLDAEYRGMSHDASSYFSDNITELLAPYNVRGMIKFTPSMLSGFYADTSDVDSELYVVDSYEFANEETMKKISACPEFTRLQFKMPDRMVSLNNDFNTTNPVTDNTLYPVWFLSYQNGDRVLYATINGQTGKAVADIPVDGKKYLLGSLLLAVPIFMIMNFFVALRPATLLSVASGFSLITTIIYYNEIKKIIRRETNADDRGKRLKRDGWKAVEQKGSKKQPYTKGCGIVLLILVMIPALAFIMGVFGGITNFLYFLPVIVFAVTLILTIYGCKNLEKLDADRVTELAIDYAAAQNTGYYTGQNTNQGRNTNSKSKKSIGKKGKWKSYGGRSAFIFALIANIVAALIMFVRPIADWTYYGTTLIMAAVVLGAISGIIKKYNMLSTRKMPKLHDRGGQNHV